MRPARPRTPGVLFAATALFASASARAGNGIHERTPVQWPADTACMTVIDRGQSPVLHFDYEIPYEDTMVTMDEVADSRRHQFVGFCQNHSPQEPLPVWLSWADVAAAEAAGIAEASDYTDEDVMETSGIYKDCFVRITADDERRKITFAEAAKGFDWDTTGLPAGGYVVQGYTWEPAFNIWRKRPGVVHVVDGPDLAAVGPAAALTNEEDYLFGDDTLMLTGCARAMPGSVMNGYWSLTGEDGLNWQPFAEDVPLAGEAIALPFTPPAEAIQQTIALRVDVIDPMQRSFIAYPMELLVVLPAGGGGSTTGCSDSGNFIGNESCGDSGDTTEPAGTTFEPLTTGGPGTSSSTGGGTEGTGSGTGVPMSDDPGTPGCACRSRDSGGGWALAGVALLGLARRRRTRS